MFVTRPLTKNHRHCRRHPSNKFQSTYIYLYSLNVLHVSFVRPVTPSPVQFGVNVASNMAICESKWPHVRRISESWHVHSSITSANIKKAKKDISKKNVCVG